MWTAWYVFHLPGVHIPSHLSTPILLLILCFGCAWGARAASAERRAAAWAVGLFAGLVAGMVNLLLLGSRVVEQPQSTGEMIEQANRLSPQAPTIILGFLGLCATVGLAGGSLATIGSARIYAPIPWRSLFAVVTAFTLVPLVIAGGLVTSTESGMAVPDSVTTYGSILVLFPLSLMAEPRIFFEHTHRLFGTFVGLTTIVLACWSMLGDRAWKIAALVALAIVAVVLPFALELVGLLPLAPTIAWLAIAAMAALGTLIWSVLAARLPLAAGLLLLLVITQGLLGALRVSEISTPLAYAHGVLAQLVFAGAAGLAAASIGAAPSGPEALSEPTRAALRLARALGPWAAAAVIVQLVLGAGFRHTSSSILLYSHALFAAVVAALTLMLGVGMSSDESPDGRRTRRLGHLLLTAVILQVGLGITAFVLVSGRSARPIPTYEQLSTAHDLPFFEAAFTTSHQALGAGLLALTVAIAVLSRARLARKPT
ncbi:MAG: hypothetical protein KJZ65_07565 [Phycisphaerales bacterium]|nr:hypothetical protein [Phycisphaerales bacterium]